MTAAHRTLICCLIGVSLMVLSWFWVGIAQSSQSSFTDEDFARYEFSFNEVKQLRTKAELTPAEQEQLDNAQKRLDVELVKFEAAQHVGERTALILRYVGMAITMVGVVVFAISRSND